MTLIQTAKLNGVNPMAYLADVLERVVSGRTKQNEMHTLLPWNWTASTSVTITQPSGLAAGSAAAPIVNSNPAPSPPQRLRCTSRASGCSSTSPGTPWR